MLSSSKSQCSTTVRLQFAIDPSGFFSVHFWPLCSLPNNQFYEFLEEIQFRQATEFLNYGPETPGISPTSEETLEPKYKCHRDQLLYIYSCMSAAIWYIISTSAFRCGSGMASLKHMRAWCKLKSSCRCSKTIKDEDQQVPWLSTWRQEVHSLIQTMEECFLSVHEKGWMSTPPQRGKSQCRSLFACRNCLHHCFPTLGPRVLLD